MLGNALVQFADVLPHCIAHVHRFCGQHSHLKQIDHIPVSYTQLCKLVFCFQFLRDSLCFFYLGNGTIPVSYTHLCP